MRQSQQQGRAIPREDREAVLGGLRDRGVPPSAIWVRFLTREGLQLGDGALREIGRRHDGDGDRLLEAWRTELATRIDVARGIVGSAADDLDGDAVAALVAVREGPELALLLAPDAAFATAVRPFGVHVRPPMRGTLRRALTTVGQVLGRHE